LNNKSAQHKQDWENELRSNLLQFIKAINLAHVDIFFNLKILPGNL